MKRKHLAYILTAFIVWIISIISFWTVLPPADGLFYKIFIQWMLWPICIITISLHAYAICDNKLIAPLLGVSNMFAEFFTFLISPFVERLKLDLFSIVECLVFFAAGFIFSIAASTYASGKKNIID